ncbi:uncharacterized protein LOC121864197 isoform X1 [Homarus americanus]|nr:uncharacterized protein LOC121864197 isoform X1 [Homarus americanus]XP_042219145.1 uncharacterized protein LOC121864197 isoform X1 [Homarus americanus]
METRLLEDIIHLLQDVEWLYNFPVTQIFTRNVFSQMPEEWRDALLKLPVEILNTIPQYNSQEHWPSSLQLFLKKCKRLSLHHLVVNPHDGQPDTHQKMHLPQEITKGMSTKKKHEVASLLYLVKRLSDTTQSRHVLDVGSGIGYIDTLLHHILKFTILGAESVAEHVRSANTRQQKLSGQCTGIRHLHWSLADDEGTLHKAEEVISELVQVDQICTCQVTKKSSISGETSDKPPVFIMNKEHESSGYDEGNNSESVVNTDGHHPKKSAILLGLHACADLSPIMMKIYKESSRVSSLVLLSCCYHKMQKQSTHDVNISQPEKLCGQETVMEEEFVNFPMSKALKNILQQNNVHMSTFGLRLAAQESGLRWIRQTAKDHENHKKNVAYRALLEVFCIREGFTLRKLRRRCVRKSHFEDFSEYIRNVVVNYEFIPSKGNVHVTGPSKNKRFSDASSPHLQSTEKSQRTEKDNDAAPHQSLDTSERRDLPAVTEEYITRILQKCYEDYQHLFPLIEPLTGLQLALQPVMEALVFVDRVAYLKECGFTNVWLEKVFDVEVSPRNVALVALR